MAENEEKKETEQTESPKGKNSLLMVIILGVIIIILGGGGIAGWFMFFTKDTAEADQTAEAEPAQTASSEATQSIIVPLESFIVNLMDRSSSGKRYLKTTIELDVPDEESQGLVGVRKAQLRDAILLLLTSQSFAEINTTEGKQALKKALLLRINQALGGRIVSGLYFTEFVVQ
jgi:flagellar FliL protein